MILEDAISSTDRLDSSRAGLYSVCRLDSSTVRPPSGLDSSTVYLPSGRDSSRVVYRLVSTALQFVYCLVSTAGYVRRELTVFVEAHSIWKYWTSTVVPIGVDYI